MRKIIAALLLISFVALSTAMSGCSTVEGVGKDIQKGGEAIQRKAK